MFGQSNICLLEKLVWDLIQSSDKLWVNLLSNKHAAGRNVLQANASSSSSTI